MKKKHDQVRNETPRTEALHMARMIKDVGGIPAHSN